MTTKKQYYKELLHEITHLQYGEKTYYDKIERLRIIAVINLLDNKNEYKIVAENDQLYVIREKQ